VLTSAPAASIFYPKATVRGGWQTMQGLWEMPFALYKGTKEEGFGETLDLLWEGIKEDYKYRYGENWREAMRDEPLSNLFDALTVFGTLIRGASLAGAAGRLGRAGVRYTPRDIWRESARPGLISEGTPWVRELEFQPSVGALESQTWPYSRSPLRRGAQDLADFLASSAPEAPIFGARARISRADARTLQRNFDRLMGTVRHISAIDKLPEAGRTRLFWGTQLGNHSDSALLRLKNALEHEYEGDTQAGDGELAEALWEAKQLGFGKELLKRLDAAIEYQPDAQYERAIEAMRDMTDLAENVIADANGFTSLSTDLKRAEDRLAGLSAGSEAYARVAEEVASLTKELAEKEDSLRAMFGDRRRRLLDWVNAKSYSDTPERREWLEVLTEMFGEEQAQTMIQFADAMANVKRSPARFWRDSIGRPSQEAAKDFMGRIGNDALFQKFGPWGKTSLVEGDVLKPAATSAFHSPLQKWITENWPPIPQVPPRELRGKLRKAISPEEYSIANLDMFFDEMALKYGPNDPISQDDLMRWLANPLNAHNLIEHHRVNTPEAWPDGVVRSYDEPSIVSRNPQQGEYHEFVYQVPEPIREYGGRGWSHWNMDNVVFHIRFQDFLEGGKRKVVIEEIQSDWASEYRKHAKYLALPAEEKARHAALLGEINDAHGLANDLYERHKHDWWARAYPETIAAQDKYNAIIERIGRLSDEADEIMPHGADVTVPPSPWGNRYLTTAVRRMMRYAADNNVDEIIIVDPTVQHVRNAGKPIEGLESYILERVDNAEVRDVLDQAPNPGWQRTYRDKMKQVFDRELGEEGQVVDSAYQGRYSGQKYPGESIEGDMRGLVYSVTPSVRERAEISLGLFQRQPDWDALPKGATELLAGGGTRVHIFQDGDVSTWIHELGHVAVHDLDDADRNILAAHYAGGKQIADWKEAEHENFARDWERWVREGVAPTSALAGVFQRISAWMKAVLGKAEEEGALPDEVRRVFKDMFMSEDEPDIFIPHRPGGPALGGERTTRGIPRAKREIGDRTFSRIPLFKRNTLALLRSGLLNDDPRQLIEHTNRVIMLARANQLREAVLEMGEMLLPGEYPDFRTQYVVKRAGRGVDKPLFDALETADDPEAIRNTMRDFVDEHITDEEQKYEQWAGESQLYVVDKRVVDMLFKNVTGKTPGATTKPGGTTGAVIDAALDSLRGLLLYANPGFYTSNMVGNAWMMSTADPTAWKHMVWSMKNAVKAAKPGEDLADPLWERISVEMGRGPTSGQFTYRPEFIGAGPQRTGRVVKRGAEAVSYGMGRWGRKAGRVIDDSFRVAAWRQAAAKRGYNTKAEIDKLLDEAARDRKGMLRLDTKERQDLAAIRDEAENLMLDFDSMTPFERTYLQRAIFLYPFIRASAKYPIMYMGERPITAGLIGQAGLTGQALSEQVLGPRPGLPAWAQGYARGPGGWFNVGSVMPQSMPLDLAEMALGIGQPTEIGVNRPYSMFNPLAQTLVSLLRSQNRYGRDAPAWEILRSDFPAPAYLAQFWGRKPSEVYTDRDKLATLLRALRLTPFGLEETE
jgi:hypothetical protein